MTDAQPSGQRLETRITHLVQVAYTAVNNRPDAAQGAVYIRVDLAPERPDEIRLVQILHDDDLRPRGPRHLTAIFIPSVGIIFPMLGIARFANDRYRVTDHRAHLRHEINGFFKVEAVAPRVAFRHLLPAVVTRGRIPSTQFQQFAVRPAARYRLIIRSVIRRNHYYSLLLISCFKGSDV